MGGLTLGGHVAGLGGPYLSKASPLLWIEAGPALWDAPKGGRGCMLSHCGPDKSQRTWGLRLAIPGPRQRLSRPELEGAQVRSRP
jgi:hypothetical protein